MADPDLKDLLDSDTEDDVLSFLLTTLANVGMPTTSWQSGSLFYSLLRVASLSISNVTSSIVAVAKGGLLSLSTGNWLRLLAQEFYSIDYFRATFAEGTVQFNVAAGAGPYTITPGQIIIYEALTRRRYFSANTTSVVFPAGPSVTIMPVKAESPGSAYNAGLAVGIGFDTPLPGVTAQFFDSTSTGTWLTTQGTDDEADLALQTRCRTRWNLLGLLKTSDAYLYLAMNTPGIGTPPTKIYVDDSNPRGPGTVDVWLAAISGPLPSADEALVNGYLQGLKSPTTDLQVENAVTTSITIAATVFYDGEFGTAIAEAADNIHATINELPIGGKLLVAQIVEDIMQVEGVVNVTLTTVLINGLNADLQLAVNSVGVFTAANLIGVVV